MSTDLEQLATQDPAAAVRQWLTESGALVPTFIARAVAHVTAESDAAKLNRGRLEAQREHLVTLARLVEHSGNEDVRRVANAALVGLRPDRLTDARGEHETRADRAAAAAIYYGIKPNGGDAHAPWIEDPSNTADLFEHELRHLTRIAGQVAAHRYHHQQKLEADFARLDADNKRLVETIKQQASGSLLRPAAVITPDMVTPESVARGAEIMRARKEPKTRDASTYQSPTITPLADLLDDKERPGG